MKNSGVEWIGEIPEDWEVKRVKNFLSERTGGAWGDEKKNNANDIICLRIADFDYSRFKFNNSTELTIRNYNTDIIEKLLLKKDDILVEKSGGGDKTPVGRAVIFEKTYKALFANFMDRLRVRNNISALFFLYVWTTYYDNKYILPYVKQTTGIQNLDITSILSGVFFPLPPKSTQQHIASYLDKKCSKIEETIQNQQQVIEKLKAYKQSLITEAVTGKIKIQNGKVCGKYQSYKESGVEWIGKIPSEWKCKRLKFIVNSFKKGNGITKDEVFVNGDTPCVRYGELYTKYNYSFTECFSKTRKDVLQTLQYFSYGDILFTCTGELIEEIGKNTVYLGNEKCLAGGDLIIASHSQNPSFLSYALNSNYAQTQKSMGKAKLKVVHISAREIGNILTILPPIEEQERIANFLDKQCIAIESSIEKKQNLIEKLTEYKKSLIYECVTGKKEI